MKIDMRTYFQQTKHPSAVGDHHRLAVGENGHAVNQPTSDFQHSETTGNGGQASEVSRTLPPQTSSCPSLPIRKASEMLPPKAITVLDDILLPITRKTSVRAVARLKRTAPIVCRVELLRAAKAALGLTDPQIGELINVDRRTVAAALTADPSTKLYTFCALVQVLGLEMAEVFPYSAKRKVVNARRLWNRGPYDNTPELLRMSDEQRAEHRKRKRFFRNND